jgi:hypothetical protein
VTRMFAWHQPSPTSHAVLLVFLIVVLYQSWQIANEYYDLKSIWIDNVPPLAKSLAYAGATVLAAVFASATPQSFIYFKF